MIPDFAKEKPRRGWSGGNRARAHEGRARQKGKVIGKKFENTIVKPGNRVYYDQYGGTQIEIDQEGLLMIREENILGLVE